MTLFVDASALVAILAEEPGWEAFERRVAEADILLWSAMSRYEAILGLRRSRGITLADAERDVDALATAFRFQMIAIGEEAVREPGKDVMPMEPATHQAVRSERM